MKSEHLHRGSDIPVQSLGEFIQSENSENSENNNKSVLPDIDDHPYDTSFDDASWRPGTYLQPAQERPLYSDGAIDVRSLRGVASGIDRDQSAHPAASTMLRGTWRLEHDIDQSTGAHIVRAIAFTDRANGPGIMGVHTEHIASIDINYDPDSGENFLPKIAAERGLLSVVADIQVAGNVSDQKELTSTNGRIVRLYAAEQPYGHVIQSGQGFIPKEPKVGRPVILDGFVGRMDSSNEHILPIKVLQPETLGEWKYVRFGRIALRQLYYDFDKSMPAGRRPQEGDSLQVRAYRQEDNNYTTESNPYLISSDVTFGPLRQVYLKSDLGGSRPLRLV